jgi:hypothetical protein
MQVRCQNCDASLSVPPGELREIKRPRISAEAWLKANHRLVNPVAPAVSNALDRPVLPVAPTHAFP